MKGEAGRAELTLLSVFGGLIRRHGREAAAQIAERLFVRLGEIAQGAEVPAVTARHHVEIVFQEMSQLMQEVEQVSGERPTIDMWCGNWLMSIATAHANEFGGQRGPNWALVRPKINARHISERPDFEFDG